MTTITRYCEEPSATKQSSPSARGMAWLDCFAALAMTAFILLLSPPASANMVSTERTQTTLISEVKTIHGGEKFWVALHIEMKPGWHTYWINPGDSGIPPQLKWTLPNGFSAGPTQYLAPDRETVGPLVDYAYDNNAYYLVAITPPPILRTGMTSILALKASWLVCKDICIPESGELSLAFPAGDKSESSDDATLMAQLVNKLPVAPSEDITFSAANGELHFSWPLASKESAQRVIKSMVFFPQNDGVIENAAEQKFVVSPQTGYTLILKQAAGAKAPDYLDGVLSIYYTDDKRADYALHLQSGTGAAKVDAVTPTPAAPAEPVEAPPVPEHVTLVSAILYALIGGLILNAMPCVFPVLSLKALAVAKKAAAHPAVVRKQGIAYASGVISCFLLLAFALIAFKQGGQAVGWGYQLQSPIFVGLLSLLLFLVGLNLAGYFELPVLLGNVGGEAASHDSAWGSFLTGVLAVMVATPCTAPFMASAIGYALTQSGTEIFAVFVALGLGLASPFLLISFFPRMIRVLPKPGAWMNTFKELLSFPMFGWTVWLLWVLGRETGAQPACIVLFGMVLLAFALWLWRRENTIVRILALIVAAAGIASAVIAGQSPMLPMPMTKEEQRFSPAKLETLRKEGKAVFVDATADWCLICKVNETVALSSADVQRAFKEKDVAYLIADWTHGDEAITRYLESFGRSGVPIYVYYPPHDGSPVVLPQVLTPSTVLEVLQ